MIKQSTYDDLKKIASCHRKAFPKSYSSKLGQVYCEKMLEWFISNKNNFLFHIEKEEQCIGYLGGVTINDYKSAGPSAAMMRYSFNRAIQSLIFRPWLIFHPEIFKNFSYLKTNIFKKIGLIKVYNSKENTIKVNPYAGLLVIGVDPKYHKKGYGSILQKEFERKANEMNFSTLELSVKAQNKGAIRSYERNGWEILRASENHIRMVKNIELSKLSENLENG